MTARTVDRCVSRGTRRRTRARRTHDSRVFRRSIRAGSPRIDLPARGIRRRLDANCQVRRPSRDFEACLCMCTSGGVRSLRALRDAAVCTKVEASVLGWAGSGPTLGSIREVPAGDVGVRLAHAHVHRCVAQSMPRGLARNTPRS